MCNNSHTVDIHLRYVCCCVEPVDWVNRLTWSNGSQLLGEGST